MAWSDLPDELLCSVLDCLPLPDHIRFGAVCSSWRSAAVANPGRPAPQAPWLMLPFNPTKTPASAARFLSLSERRHYHIPQPAPDVSDRLCVGSSRGWLVTADASSELHLLNPVTGEQRPLPSVTTFPFVQAVHGSDGRVAGYTLDLGDDVPQESFEPDALRYFFYEKASVAPDFTVMLIHNPLFGLAFAKPGDSQWTVIDTPSSYWVDAICASNGQFCTLESNGRVEAWDLDGPVAASSLVAPSLGYHDCSKYLVELAPGDLAQVQRWKDQAYMESKYWEPCPQYVERVTTGVKVFRLRQPADANGPAWVESAAAEKDLAEFALFLGKNSSLCVPVSAFPELKGHCIYFTDDGSWSYEKCHDVAPDVGVFDLKDKSFNPCGGYDFQWNWPPPIWVIPSLSYSKAAE